MAQIIDVTPNPEIFLYNQERRKKKSYADEEIAKIKPYYPYAKITITVYTDDYLAFLKLCEKKPKVQVFHSLLTSYYVVSRIYKNIFVNDEFLFLEIKTDEIMSMMKDTKDIDIRKEYVKKLREISNKKSEIVFDEIIFLKKEIENIFK